MKAENLQILMNFFNEGLVMFDKEMKVFYKRKQMNVKTQECKLQLVWYKILKSSWNLLQLSSFEWLPNIAGFHRQSTEILENFFLTFQFSSVSKNIFCLSFFQATHFYYTS